MPRGDRTGPMGMGPMTGRGAGYCTGNPVPGYMNPTGGFGRGFGGGGRGRGYRNMYYATGMPGWDRSGAYPTGAYPAAPAAPLFPPYGGQGYSNEMEALTAQAQNLDKTLSDIKSRIEELKSEEAQKETE